MESINEQINEGLEVNIPNYINTLFDKIYSDLDNISPNNFKNILLFNNNNQRSQYNQKLVDKFIKNNDIKSIVTDIKSYKKNIQEILVGLHTYILNLYKKENRVPNMLELTNKGIELFKKNNSIIAWFASKDIDIFKDNYVFKVYDIVSQKNINNYGFDGTNLNYLSPYHDGLKSFLEEVELVIKLNGYLDNETLLQTYIESERKNITCHIDNKDCGNKISLRISEIVKQKLVNDLLLLHEQPRQYLINKIKQLLGELD